MRAAILRRKNQKDQGSVREDGFRYSLGVPRIQGRTGKRLFTVRKHSLLIPPKWGAKKKTLVIATEEEGETAARREPNT